jgi:fatty-acyl-CoA synthase
MIDWWGPILEEIYSSTERVGTTFISSPEWLRKPGSVGRDDGIGTVHICADDGAELPAGEIGLVYFERPTMPFGYHNDPDKTRKAQHPDHANWATTGDIGYLDEDRYLFLTDRQSFVIISGGVNIYPQEIENVLAGHPAVVDSAVVGLPDPEMGQTVHAVVQVVDDAPADDDLKKALLDYLSARIARFKVPRSLEFTATLPRTPAGKLNKSRLQQDVLDSLDSPATGHQR